jgi:hypothetical protein
VQVTCQSRLLPWFLPAICDAFTSCKLLHESGRRRPIGFSRSGRSCVSGDSLYLVLKPALPGLPFRAGSPLRVSLSRRQSGRTSVLRIHLETAADERATAAELSLRARMILQREGAAFEPFVQISFSCSKCWRAVSLTLPGRVARELESGRGDV